MNARSAFHPTAKSLVDVSGNTMDLELLHSTLIMIVSILSIEEQETYQDVYIPGANPFKHDIASHLSPCRFLGVITFIQNSCPPWITLGGVAGTVPMPKEWIISIAT